jgi:hypothetical protein
MNLRTSVIAMCSALLLAACGNSATSETTTTIPTTTTTTIASPDCSMPALETAIGEPTYIVGCSGEWAALQPKSLECGEHCFGFVYKWENSQWSLLGKCSQFSLILPEDNWCEGMSGKPLDQTFTGQPMSEFPPKEISCEIWDAHRFEENLAITGCSADSVE